jgi:hypothetical protein
LGYGAEERGLRELKELKELKELSLSSFLISFGMRK